MGPLHRALTSETDDSFSISHQPHLSFIGSRDCASSRSSPDFVLQPARDVELEKERKKRARGGLASETFVSDLRDSVRKREEEQGSFPSPTV